MNQKECTSNNPRLHYKRKERDKSETFNTLLRKKKLISMQKVQYRK